MPGILAGHARYTDLCPNHIAGHARYTDLCPNHIAGHARYTSWSCQVYWSLPQPHSWSCQVYWSLPQPHSWSCQVYWSLPQPHSWSCQVYCDAWIYTNKASQLFHLFSWVFRNYVLVRDSDTMRLHVSDILDLVVVTLLGTVIIVSIFQDCTLLKMSRYYNSTMRHYWDMLVK